MKLQDAYRAHNVKRWQIANVTRHQSLAEHSFNVAVISLDLLKRILEKHHHPELDQHLMQSNLLEWALFHDLPEIFTGDVMSMFKVLIKKNGFDPFTEIEEALIPEFKEAKVGVKDTFLYPIVKIADLLDGLKYLDLYGNDKCEHIKETRSGLRERLVAYLESKEVKKFKEIEPDLVWAVETDLMHGKISSIDTHLKGGDNAARS